MRVVSAILWLLAGSAADAAASNWAVVCTATCVALDGTTQPSGTTIEEISWDGVSPWTPPPNTHAVPFTGQSVYQPPAPPSLAPVQVDMAAFGPVCNGTADDSPALIQAILTSNLLFTQGKLAVIKLPAGVCRVVVPLPMFIGPGAIEGEGPMKSIVLLDPAYSGDLFSWSEAWAKNNFPFNGATVTLAGVSNGPMVRNLTIIGNRSSANQQNAFAFYDRNDQVLMQNVDVWFLPGRALYAGAMKAQTQAFIRESRFQNLRFFNCGLAGVPVVEFTSQGNGVGSNEIDMQAVGVYAPYGPGFVIRNATTAGILRAFRISQLRVEGLESPPTPILADLVDIGDATISGPISNISFQQTELVDPYANYAALHLTGASAPTAPYFIDFNGSVGGGVPAGNGLVIDYGRSSSFRFLSMNTTATNVVINSTAGPQIAISGVGGGSVEKAWTYSIASGVAGGVYFTTYHTGSP